MRRISYGDLAPSLLVEERGPVRLIRLNAAERLNSVDDDMHEALRLLWDCLVDDPEAGAAVITGEGRSFCTGGYMPNFIRNHEDPVACHQDMRNAERLIRAMINCDVPVVAAVNGPAVGLGASIAVLCDIVVMADDAFLADPHVSVGVVAGDGGAVTWPLHVGLLRAKEHLLLGDRIAAAECEHLGLANHVVPSGEVVVRALELADRLAGQPRRALRDTKRALNLHLQTAADLVLGFGLAAEGASFASDDVLRTVEEFQARSGKVRTT